jgi:hypothetical protein
VCFATLAGGSFEDASIFKLCTNNVNICTCHDILHRSEEHFHVYGK